MARKWCMGSDWRCHLLAGGFADCHRAKEYRGREIGKDVVLALKGRAKALGFDSMNVREIYDYNEGSKRLFESMGFVVSGKTEKGHAYRLNLREKP